MEGILTLAVFVVAFGSLVFISTPPRPGQRLRFKRKEGIGIPAVCVLTGEPASEAHPLRGFTGSPYHVGKTEMLLPFSAGGWKRYSKAYPISLSVFKGGMNALMRVPLFGAYFAIFMWTPLVGFFLGLIAFVELFFHKRQLVVPLGVSIKEERLTRIDILGVSEKFIEAFLAANGQMTLTDYRASMQRRTRIQLVLVLVLLLAVAALIIFAVVQGRNQ